MEYYDLGRHSRPVTTSSPHAQTWFDRGLVWTYGFNHEEAVYCFELVLLPPRPVMVSAGSRPPSRSGLVAAS